MRTRPLALALVALLAGCGSPAAGTGSAYRVSQGSGGTSLLIMGNWNFRVRYQRPSAPVIPETSMAGTLNLFHGAAYPTAPVMGSYQIGTHAGSFEGSYAYRAKTVTLQLDPLPLPGLGRSSVACTLTLDAANRSATGPAVITYSTASGTESITGTAEMTRP